MGLICSGASLTEGETGQMPWGTEKGYPLVCSHGREGECNSGSCGCDMLPALGCWYSVGDIQSESV